MAAGIFIGKFLPGIPTFLGKLQYAGQNIPIAVLIWIMIYPMMMKIDFQSIKNVRKHPLGLVISTGNSWLIKPFLMFGLASLFFYVIFKALIPADMAKDYVTGAVLLGVAPCTAMVFVWSNLTKGDPAHTLVQVSINDLLIMTTRVFRQEDWEAVSRIYAEGVATGTAVFNNHLPTWEEWDDSHLKACRLVAEENGVVVGWTALTVVSNRCMDSGVAEGSAYVAADFRGKGVGKALLNSLIEASEKAGFWMLQAQIIQENTASISLCEACGFRRVGYRERINRDMCGVWHNLVLFERRSKTVEGCGCGCCG